MLVTLFGAAPVLPGSKEMLSKALGSIFYFYGTSTFLDDFLFRSDGMQNVLQRHIYPPFFSPSIIQNSQWSNDYQTLTITDV